MLHAKSPERITVFFFFGGGGGGGGCLGLLFLCVFFLCPHDDSQGALRFAPVRPSVCPSVPLSVRSSRFTV